MTALINTQPPRSLVPVSHPQPPRRRRHSPLALWASGLSHVARHYVWLKSDARWGGWVAGGVVSFALLQSWGFADYPHGDHRHTLSAFTRRWLGVYPQRPRRLAASIGLVGALGVFTAHVLVGPAPDERYEDPDPRFR